MANMAPEKSKISLTRNWWSRYLKSYKDAKLFSEYLRNANIHGYSLIVAKNRTKADKILWTIISTVVISITSWFVITIYVDFINTPTTTNQLPDRTPIWNIPFPAVAICSGSRFNKRTLWEYAEKIFDFQKNSTTQLGHSTEEVFNALKLIGNFFSIRNSAQDYYSLDKLHTVLLEMYGGTYNTRQLIMDLSISCSELLVRCKFLDKFIDCAEIFELRAAYIGMCCVFNYNRSFSEPNKNYNENDPLKKPYKPIFVPGSGKRNGLSVVVDDDFSKFTFKLYSSVSTKIGVFEPHNYPDAMSTALSEGHVIAGREVQVMVYPVIITGDAAMRKFRPQVRKCFFRDESYFVLQGIYSLSECLITCRFRDLYDFCGCVAPHMSNTLNAPYCLLKDIACIGNWWDKWMAFEPLNSVNVELDEFLHCPHCLSQCEITKYSMQTSYYDINAPANGKYYEFGILQNLTRTDLSIVNIYFAENYAVRMHKSVIYDWLEILALLGGICSLMFGASILSVAELGYFFSGKFFAIWMKGPRDTKMEPGYHGDEKFEHGDEKFQPTLNWNELAGKKTKHAIKDHPRYAWHTTLPPLSIARN